MSIFRGGALAPRIYGLPPGGAQYQVLHKLTGDDGDVAWTDSLRLQSLDVGFIDIQTFGEGFAFLTGVVTINSNLAWHAGNDGAGSGLDADLLDGQQGTYYRAWGNLTSVPVSISTVAGLTPAADRLPYYTGASTAALATFTAAGRALVDDADAAAQRTTLGLGTMATQAANSVAITGGFATFNQACSVSSAGASLYVDNTSSSYSGDILKILGSNSTSTAYYVLRVYNYLGNPVGGIRGDSAYVTNSYVAAAVFHPTQINHGVVGSARTITWASGAFQTLTLTAATNLTLTFTAPTSPGFLTLKITAPASSNPTITYPASVVGGPPTAVTAVNKYMLLVFFYDGVNYVYTSGAKNL